MSKCLIVETNRRNHNHCHNTNHPNHPHHRTKTALEEHSHITNSQTCNKANKIMGGTINNLSSFNSLSSSSNGVHRHNHSHITKVVGGAINNFSSLNSLNSSSNGVHRHNHSHITKVVGGAINNFSCPNSLNSSSNGVHRHNHSHRAKIIGDNKTHQEVKIRSKIHHRHITNNSNSKYPKKDRKRRWPRGSQGTLPHRKILKRSLRSRAYVSVA